MMDADEVAGLVADNERLRGLLKQVEFEANDGCCEGGPICPWCGEDKGHRHQSSCPAFLPDGQVK